jgi:hypothetical protein
MGRVVLILAVGTVSLLAGCAPGPLPSATPGPTSGDDPWATADGRVLGTIVAVDVDAPSVTLDLGQWFGDPDEATVAGSAARDRRDHVDLRAGRDRGV